MCPISMSAAGAIRLRMHWMKFRAWVSGSASSSMHDLAVLVEVTEAPRRLGLPAADVDVALGAVDGDAVVDPLEHIGIPDTHLEAHHLVPVVEGDVHRVRR